MPRLVAANLRQAAVGPFDLDVAAGSSAAITGPSGAGKSLFLRMIADLDPHEGEARLGDMRREAVPAPVWRRAVCYVAAEPGWWATTAAAHIPLAARPAAEAMAARLGLNADHLDVPVARLSTGERQRLGLIRALSRDPAALLLDEPTSALDAGATAAVEDLLRERLAKGLILVFVTHDRSLADRLGQQRLDLVAGAMLGAKQHDADRIAR